MKKALGLIIIFFAMTSCRQATESSFDNILKTDTVCIKELIKAKKDLSESKMFYCDYAFLPRHESEMTALLKQFNIHYKFSVTSDVIVTGHTNDCYCDYMREQIDSKFGKKFIDSLLYISDSTYISKNLDRTYEYSEWDIPPIFPGDNEPDVTNHSGLQKVFEKQFIYPKNYRFKSSDTSFAMVKVFVDIDNKGIAKVDSCWFHFWDHKTKEEDFNKSVWPALEKTFRSIIEQTHWTPAKIKSFDVKSKNEIFVYFK